LHHARTQFGYAVPVIIGTIVSFVVVGLVFDYGLWTSFYVSFGAGIAVSVLLLYIGNKFFK